MESVFKKEIGQKIIDGTNLYTISPNTRINLQELELLANSRADLLKKMEILTIKYPKNSSEYDSQLKNLIREYDKSFAKFEEKRKLDEISHFLLRLAFCKQQRLTNETSDNIRTLLTQSNLDYETVIK
ncbi:hypothetical protein HZS_5467 [Henneguya salminicola]|nr:hypothetical protein HZS_5467 [Henneguya salminicola]